MAELESHFGVSPFVRVYLLYWGARISRSPDFNWCIFRFSWSFSRIFAAHFYWYPYGERRHFMPMWISIWKQLKQSELIDSSHSHGAHSTRNIGNPIEDCTIVPPRIRATISRFKHSILFELYLSYPLRDDRPAHCGKHSSRYALCQWDYSVSTYPHTSVSIPTSYSHLQHISHCGGSLRSDTLLGMVWGGSCCFFLNHCCRYERQGQSTLSVALVLLIFAEIFSVTTACFSIFREFPVLVISGNLFWRMRMRILSEKELNDFFSQFHQISTFQESTLYWRTTSRLEQCRL